MAGYIGREALIQRLENSPLFTNFGVDGFFICDGVIDIIKKQPSVKSAAEVVEVRHGEWVQNDLSVWADSPTDGFPVAVCSVCGMKFCDIINNMDYMFNHCPHCGAKMDGKDGAE